MSTCCQPPGARNSPRWVRSVREVFAWAGPSAALAVVPKCPACLAAYVTLWTGLGLSLSAASYLRWALLFVCVASLLFLTVKRVGAICYPIKRETGPCGTK